jgi:hypothetical protein
LADGAVDRMEQKLNAFLNEVPRQAQAISESAEPDPDFTAEQTMEAASAFVFTRALPSLLHSLHKNSPRPPSNARKRSRPSLTD